MEQKETDADRLSRLSDALAALAGRLEAADAARLADRVATAMEQKETDAVPTQQPERRPGGAGRAFGTGGTPNASVRIVSRAAGRIPDPQRRCKEERERIPSRPCFVP